MRKSSIVAGLFALTFLVPSALCAQSPESVEALFAAVPSVPHDHPARQSLLRDAAGEARATAGARFAPALATSCRMRTPEGNPGCLIVFADFNTSAPGDEAVVIAGPLRSELWGFQLSGNGEVWVPYGLVWDSYALDGGALIDDLHRNGVRLEPNPLQLLRSPTGASISLRPSVLNDRSGKLSGD